MLGTESRRVTDLFDFLWRNRPDRMPAGTRADSKKQDKELIRPLMVESCFSCEVSALVFP